VTLPSENYGADIKQDPWKRRPQWSKSTSPYGYALDECLSAMVKELRYGKDHEALYWAHQLAISGSRAEKFMWEALHIFAVEDIGPAQSEALGAVQASKKSYDDFEHGYDAKYLFLANAIVMLAECEKTRYVENRLSLMLYRLRNGNVVAPEIPDRAYDFHLRKGKEMGRDLEHYYKFASRLTNESDLYEGKFTDGEMLELKDRSMKGEVK
jgi:replication-associated recombination protein RarA